MVFKFASSSFLVLLVVVCTLGAPNVSDIQDDLDSLSLIQSPRFTQSIYRAILDDDQTFAMDSPIVVNNANDEIAYIITSDNYDDYYLKMVDSNRTDQIILELEAVTTTPMGKDIDIVTVEVIDVDSVPIARAAILISAANRGIDIYRMTFKVDKEEYIVLNFFYFKWFLGILIATGILILSIELLEIVNKVRKARSSTGKYEELQNV